MIAETRHQFGMLRFFGGCFLLCDQDLHHGKKYPTLTERVRVVYARDNQRASPVAREPTVYFPQAERSAG